MEIFILILLIITFRPSVTGIEFSVLKLNDRLVNISIYEIKDTEEKIQDLKASALNMGIINENFFIHLHYLELLDLSTNNISIIKEHAFKYLNNLQILKLFRNNISILPTNIFHDTPNISRIYLQYNKIITIQNDMFSNLRYLKLVDLSNNNLFSIHENSFKNVPEFSYLNLYNNSLKHISSNIFANLNNIKKVNLGCNPWNCDKYLCAIMNITVSSSWDKNSMPICYYPLNKRNKTWKEILQIKNPTITYTMDNIDNKQMITLECNICTSSNISWYYENEELVTNATQVTSGYFTSSILHAKYTGTYTCRMQNCLACEKDEIRLSNENNIIKIITGTSNKTFVQNEDGTEKHSYRYFRVILQAAAVAVVLFWLIIIIISCVKYKSIIIIIKNEARQIKNSDQLTSLINDQHLHQKAKSTNTIHYYTEITDKNHETSLNKKSQHHTNNIINSSQHTQENDQIQIIHTNALQKEHYDFTKTQDSINNNNTEVAICCKTK